MLGLEPIPTSKACLSTPLLQMLHTTTSKTTPALFPVHHPCHQLPLISMVHLAAWLLLLTTQTSDLVTSCLDNLRKPTHSPWGSVRAQINMDMVTMHDEPFYIIEYICRNSNLMLFRRAALDFPLANGSRLRRSGPMARPLFLQRRYCDHRETSKQPDNLPLCETIRI